MPNPSLLAMEEEAAREVFSLTEVEYEAVTKSLEMAEETLNNPEHLTPEAHAWCAGLARALRKVLHVADA